MDEILDSNGEVLVEISPEREAEDETSEDADEKIDGEEGELDERVPESVDHLVPGIERERVRDCSRLSEHFTERRQQSPVQTRDKLLGYEKRENDTLLRL